MGRPLGTKNVMKTTKEKEEIVLEYLNSKQSLSTIGSKHNVYISVIKRWVRNYRNSGIDGLKSKTGQNYSSNFGKHNREATEVDKLKRELLKKGYMVKGVGEEKEYVTTFDVNTK